MSSAEFAAAQQRVAARQQQREAAARTQAERQAQLLTGGNVSRLPPAVLTAWTAASVQWNLIRGREGSKPAFRVGQVDAELLDEELLQLLKGQVGEALKYFGTHLQSDWEAEILLALRATIFKLTIWNQNASYGAALQNLRYRDARQKKSSQAFPSRWQKSIYGLVSVGGRYGWSKWETYLLDVESGYDEPSARMRSLSRVTNIAAATHSTAAFLSFLVFLYNGKYRTILDRLLRLRLAPGSSQVNREVSFEYLNRQLVWHAFTEFLLFLLPLVGISRWRRWMARAWRKIKSLFRRNGDIDDEDTKTGGELGFLPERTCAICYQDQNPTSMSETELAGVTGASGGVIGSAQTDITSPYECIPCGCIYCFICIAQRLEAEDGEGWVCLRCGEMVYRCKPWNADVVEDDRHAIQPGKSVSFAAEDDSKSITALDPHPVEDEKAVQMAELIHRTSTSLAGSSEWMNIGVRGESLQEIAHQEIHETHEDEEEEEGTAAEDEEGEDDDHRSDHEAESIEYPTSDDDVADPRDDSTVEDSASEAIESGDDDHR